ncbi:MAG: AMP-binding protein [Bdellovibrionota bacterium]|nr:AMP-binding protein [Bdellovibrionota bacterium]
MSKIWFDFYHEKRPKTINVEEKNLEQFFQGNFNKFSKSVAFESLGQGLTFEELDILSLKFASFLQKRCGVKKGDRVALLIPNILQFVVASLGILRAGAVLVPLNPLYTKAEIKKLLWDGVDGKGKGAVKPKLIIALDKFAVNLEEFANTGKVDNIVITKIGDLIGGLKGKVINFVFKHIKKEVQNYSIKNEIPFLDFFKYDTAFDRPKMKISDEAILQFTGGTSGTIKAATLTQKNILSNLYQNINLVGQDTGDGKHWAKDDTFLGILPLFHIYALNTAFLNCIGIGYKVILVPNPRDLNAVVKTWSKNKVTITAGINTLFVKLLDHPKFNSKNIDFSCLKFLGSGGMAIQEKTYKALSKRTGGEISVGYGLSETSPVISAHDRFRKGYTSSVGLPYASTDIKILSDKNEELDVGGTGEICVKGPQVMKGYWDLEEETEKAFTEDGYFRTGDIGYIGKDGELYIVDRKKDMINVSGLKVYPQEIESVVNKHPSIVESGVIAAPDDLTGEAVALFVVKKDDALTASEIIGHMREELTNYKIPKIVTFIDEIPKSPIGKLLRRELRSFLPGT